MDSESRKFLDKPEMVRYWNLLRDNDITSHIDMTSRKRLLTIAKENFDKRYTVNLFCNSCTASLLRYVFEQYQQLKDKEESEKLSEIIIGMDMGSPDGDVTVKSVVTFEDDKVFMTFPKHEQEEPTNINASNKEHLKNLLKQAGSSGEVVDLGYDIVNIKEGIIESIPYLTDIEGNIHTFEKEQEEKECNIKFNPEDHLFNVEGQTVTGNEFLQLQGLLHPNAEKLGVYMRNEILINSLLEKDSLKEQEQYEQELINTEETIIPILEEKENEEGDTDNPSLKNENEIVDLQGTVTTGKKRGRKPKQKNQ